MLVGRKREQAALAELVQQAQRGRGAALLVTGEPGIGKSALLDDAAERLGGRGILLRAAGREADLDLPFATLAGLLRPAERQLRALPLPQAHALRHALGLDEGTPPVDRLSVGVAALGVLAGLTSHRTVLAVVDDLQWADASSRAAILFAAARLAPLRVALVLAVRPGELAEAELAGLPTLSLAGLSTRDAGSLLSGAARVPVDRAVRRRLLEVCKGNPLALLEVPPALTDAQLAGGEPLGDPVPVNGGIERAFGGRIGRLPPRTREALLVLAAAGSDDGEVVAAALAKRRLGASDLRPAAREGLISATARRIEFRHPLVRSVVYHAHGAAERRAAHRVLADVEPDADRRAWHLQAAADGPDATAASALDAAAARALARGAPSSAASAFEAAALLSGAPADRGRRLTGAARAAHRAGDVAAARRLSAAARDSTADPIQLADLVLVESDLRMRDGDLEGAHHELVRHGEQLAELDARRATTMLLLAAKLRIYRLEAQIAVDEVERALSLLPSGQQDVVHLVALAMSRVVAGREGARDAALAAAAAATRSPHGHAHTLGIAWPLIWLEEYEAARDVISRALAIQREAGFLLYLPQALLTLAELDFRTGDWPGAVAAGEEALELFDETRQPSEAAAAAGVLARMEAARGNAEACASLAQRALASDVEFGLRSSSAHALAALGLLALGARRPQEAIAPLEAAERIAALGAVGEPWLLLSKPDLVEGLARAGHRARALDVLSDFERMIEGTGRRSAAAAAARCAGIVAEGRAWRDEFERALALHDGLPTPFERARTELSYGERLRRARRRSEARPRLQHALEAFDELGAAPWADRARAELQASGETARGRSSPAEALTPQELAVARLVADGRRNREAAAALFVSEKTIEYHLAGVYRKLGIRSRVELARLMSAPRQ